MSEQYVDARDITLTDNAAEDAQSQNVVEVSNGQESPEGIPVIDSTAGGGESSIDGKIGLTQDETPQGIVIAEPAEKVPTPAAITIEGQDIEEYAELEDAY